MSDHKTINNKTNDPIADKTTDDKTTNKPILVTRPSLPPLDDFVNHLEEIWDKRVLTNGGPFHQRLEEALCKHLDVPYLSLFANGTLALLVALKSMRLTGEVITTPYSFVCTSHSLLWSQLQPVFVDIDPVTLNIDPKRIEEAITPRTCAILPVHCYGVPADVAAIDKIANAYGLQVIYDAAHAFDVKTPQGSILNAGDLSVLSLHATKVFNTFEGGAVVCPDAKTKQRLDHLKNFGLVDETTIIAPGINAKMNEVCAALGLLQLQHMGSAIARRLQLAERYRSQLAGIAGLRCLAIPSDVQWNGAYFPIFVGEEFGMDRDALYLHLKQEGIFTRRYFYPLISNLPMYRALPSASAANLPHANRASAEVLCLPLYPDLLDEEVDRVTRAIAKVAHGERVVG